MRLLTSLVLVAGIISSSPRIHATELAQGHHLWSVQAPNGTHGFLAAASSNSDEQTLKILMKQIEVSAAAQRIVMSSGGEVENISVPEIWKKPAAEVLPSDLWRQVKAELASKVRSSNAIVGDLEKIPLEFVRFALFASIYKGGTGKDKNELTPNQELIFGAGKAKSGEMLFIRSLNNPKWRQRALTFRLAAKSDPVNIIRDILADEKANGPIVERSRRAYLQADWNTTKALKPLASRALWGVEEKDALALFQSAQEIVPWIAKSMSEMPTFFALYEVDFLAGDDNVLAQLQMRGFRIEPVALSDTKL